MTKHKTLRDFEREAQNKANTFQKDTYLFRRNNQYRVTFKMPKDYNLRTALSIGAVIKFSPQSLIK